MGAHHIYRSALLLSALLVVAVIAACIQVPAASPAQQTPSQPPIQNVAIYKFDPIVISPLSVTSGQPATINMRIENTGNAAGIFVAELTINGTLVESRPVPIEAGSWARVEFSSTFPTAGHYEIKIAPQVTAVDIPERKEFLRLKLDNGIVDGCDDLVGSTGDPGNMIQMVEGNMIKYTAPPGGYEIDKIEILGYIKSSTHDFDMNPQFGPGAWIYGPDIAAIEPVNPNFTINIWDNRHNKLFSREYSKNLFSYIPQWVSVEVPGIKVNGDFYIELVTHNQPKLAGSGPGGWYYGNPFVVHTWYYQLCIGYEYSLNVVSSVSQNGNVVSERYMTYNWLIRTDGYRLQN
ncbi:MAG: CARDB domain-containing protein [Dehalococcoidia bacterium]|nr:CARDB domain-containing protein [Dehalococcoidia bacterium]